VGSVKVGKRKQTHKQDAPLKNKEAKQRQINKCDNNESRKHGKEVNQEDKYQGTEPEQAGSMDCPPDSLPGRQDSFRLAVEGMVKEYEYSTLMTTQPSQF